MKILIAGASGAIGQPAVDLLVQEGHEVFGVTQSKEKALTIASKGAKPVILNVLERQAVFASLSSIKPDVVIDMLTHLPKEYTPQSMQKSASIDAQIRKVGGANLQSAAEENLVKRYIVQSSGFWYEEGSGLADESTPFAVNATEGIAAGVKIYLEIEQRVLESQKIEGVSLRFGFFYGPGTWFHPQGNVAEQLQIGEFPLIGSCEGVWNFIHIEDAAKAIRSAIYATQGSYNVVNNHPSKMSEWLPAFARFVGAKRPLKITEEEGLKSKGADFVYYATKLRGASNQKAKNAFNFEPRNFEWLL